MRNNIIIFLFFAVICLVNMSSRAPDRKEKKELPAVDTLKMAEVTPEKATLAKPIGDKEAEKAQHK